ncbi:MAG: glucose-6-phosphate isomerase [bacterium]
MTHHDVDPSELSGYQSAAARALDDLTADRIIPRIWGGDHTVWKPKPDEIRNRLGWLHSPESMRNGLPEIASFVSEIRKAGFTHTLLLGMGGSSLAPEMFRRTFGLKEAFPDLSVLDSTDPGFILSCQKKLDLNKTLFVVSTKSGGTVETLSLYKYFYHEVTKAVGKDAGRHFAAITDPGSQLVDLAKKGGFRKTFLNDPNIGGRFSALSYFGLVPASLIGMDLDKLLNRSAQMAVDCQEPAEANPGAWLGAVLSALVLTGRDKMTFVASPALAPFGAWAEQLIAESTGKEGKGLLPVDGEELVDPQMYRDDRFFVYLRLDSDSTHDAKVQALKDAGHPVIQLNLQDVYDLGGELFRWEMATAVASWRLEINPFDQPDVESAKVQSRKMMAAFQVEGKLPEERPNLGSNGIKVYFGAAAESLSETLRRFLDARDRSYIALQAYLNPSKETDAALNSLRNRLREKTKLATTVGYGPRFLHSTGQLHKGDSGRGLFIQITADSASDIAIPDRPEAETSTITFGVLKMAQALGDRRALLEKGRKVIRFHLQKDVIEGLNQIEKALL